MSASLSLLIPEAANIVLDALKWLEQTDRMKLDAAIVMPDHMHFIAALKNAGLPKLMQSLKGYTSRQINTSAEQERCFLAGSISRACNSKRRGT